MEDARTHRSGHRRSDGSIRDHTDISEERVIVQYTGVVYALLQIGRAHV